MKPYTLHLGDCLEVLKTLPDNSVDSVVTDPPYGLSKEPDMAEVLRHWLAGDDYQHKGGGFMGKSWDSFVPGPAVWRECLRVLKPGGHLLSFFGSRTYDMGVLAIRLAGFEIRDQILWLYGSGFPKSMNVANAIHDAAIGQPQGGAKPGSANHGKFKGGCSDENATGRGFGAGPGQFMADAGAKKVERDLVPEAQQWEGFGTALKPAHEPIVVARKPFAGTVANNVLEHGTGAFNIDGCRVGTVTGRWPANVVHDGSDEVVSLFPAKAGAAAPVRGTETSAASVGKVTGKRDRVPGAFHADQGSAARFFYCAKASRADRNAGLADPGPQFEHGATLRKVENTPTKGNNHPTVKPTELMRWLVRLVTPPGGTVLDPFMGSGSTGRGAMLEGFQFVGIEMDPRYVAIAEARIEAALADPAQQELFGVAAE